MCEERRSTVQVVKMDGDKSEYTLSINIKAVTAYLGLLVLIIALASSLYAGVTKLGSIQAETVLKPVVVQCVQEEVQKQLGEVTKENDMKLRVIQKSLETLTLETRALNGEIKRNSNMLEILLKDRLRKENRK